MTKVIRPYGSWPSPISSQRLTQSTPSMSEPQFDGDNLFWLESRPNEKGRNAIVKRSPDGKCQDVLPHPLNARNQVNEYGGGSYCVRQGVIYFVLYSDQRIYRLDTNRLNTKAPGAFPEVVTAESLLRFADLQFDAHHNQLIAICEDHSQSPEPSNSIVSIALTEDRLGEISTLVSGADFYSSPRVSPDGKRLAWISWNHPNMPWDATTCYLGDFINAQALSNVTAVDATGQESLCQPRWSPDGQLYVVSDRNNWWNIYRVNQQQLEAVTTLDAEFASPQWVFGLSNYDFLNSNTLITSYNQDGLWHLASVDCSTGKITPIANDFTDIAYITAHNNLAVFIGANSTQNNNLVSYSPSAGCQALLENPQALAPDTFAQPVPIRFPCANAAADCHAYGFFYPPTSPQTQGPADELPPLIVFCHGGPTAAAQSALNLKIQFWTSRGFAVADVNYGGSTGYGRDYRQRLHGQWGIVDVQDVVSCVDYLIAQRWVDGDHVAIRGSSAGGFTVLAALTFTDRFKAGASLYGIGDLETLARDTHKFESRYMDNLVGPYPADADIYRARSPINHVEQLSCPVIFLQGLKDKVVPPNQAEAMVSALDQKGIPVAYVTFEDEAHGFRQAENIQRALEAELYFYTQVFAITPADELTPVAIKHGDKLARR